MRTGLYIAWLGVVLTGLVATATAQTAEELTLWKDPAFQRQFLGSYGVLAEVEPRVALFEKELMEQIVVLMSSTGGLEQARVLIEQHITPGSSAALHFTLANIYFQQDRLPQAAYRYQRAVRKYPSFLRAHKNLGLICVRTGAYERAVGSLSKALELGARDGLTYGLLAFSYAATERQTQAETAYRQAVMLQPDVMDWRMGLARCLFKQRKFEEAAALCEELAGRDPRRADLQLLLANAYLGMKQPMRAAAVYEYLDAAGQSAPASLYLLGDLYVNEGLVDLAADAYLRALGTNTQGDIARTLRNAEILAARSAPEDAGRLLDRAEAVFGARLGPAERKRVLKLKARLVVARGAAGEEQARLLDEIITLDPLDGEALILLAQYYAGAGNQAKMDFLFERAEGLEKFEAEAKLRHGQSLVRAARYRDAVPLLKRAQELRPRDDVARYVEQVERLARARE